MNQVERRNAIKEILFSDRNAQIQNLADRFGVSVRTIKYDIEALTCSYPIETVRGRYGGGVKLADWYHPSKKALSPEQMALLKKLAPTLEGDDVHVIGTGSALRGAVVCFYLSNEGLSLLENAAHIGLPVPERPKNILAQLHNRDDGTNNNEGN